MKALKDSTVIEHNSHYRKLLFRRTDSTFYTRFQIYYQSNFFHFLSYYKKSDMVLEFTIDHELNTVKINWNDYLSENNKIHVSNVIEDYIIKCINIYIHKKNKKLEREKILSLELNNKINEI